MYYPPFLTVIKYFEGVAVDVQAVACITGRGWRAPLFLQAAGL